MALTFQKGENDKIYITKLTRNDNKLVNALSVNDVEYYNYRFIFTLLDDGTYKIAKREGTVALSGDVVLPRTYNGVNVTSIGNEAFRACSFTSITIPDSVTYIGGKAFMECRSLTRIIIPDSITEIPSRAFYWCLSLPYIVIPASVTSIGDEAFDNCTSFTDVYYEGTKEKWDKISGSDNIDSDVVIHYYSTTKPTTEGNYWHYVDGEIIEWGSLCENGHTWKEAPCIPKTCTVCGLERGKAEVPHTYGAWAIELAPTCTEKGELRRTCICCGKVDDEIPSDYGLEEYVKETGHDLVVDGESVESTCTEQGYTKYKCSKCEEPSYVYYEALGHDWTECYKDETTGEYRRDCLRCGDKELMPEPQLTYNLRDDDTYEVSAGDGVSGAIFIPAEYNGKPVTSIADNAFLFRNGITSVVIANGITSIGASAFADCAKITRVEMPDSVTSIGNYAFSKCPKLTTAVIPNGVSVIANGLFMNCRNLIGVNIPQGTTSIGNNAFYGCHNIEGVEIPDSVTSIGDYAFGDCLSITRIVIPSSVTRIGGGAFDLCNSLTYLYIGANVKKIGHSAFRGCSNLSIEVDENNKYYRMRDGCLWEINTSTVLYGEVEDIPDETAAIGSGAFYGNTFFAPIKIPLSVTSIGSLAFGGKPVTVHVEAMRKPEGWADDWCDDSVTVVWGIAEEGDTECTEHSWSLWVTTTFPTCMANGVATRRCEVCGMTQTKFVDALSHKWKAPTCTSPQTCVLCGAIVGEALGHSWGDWNVVLPAECEINGMRERKCTVCGEIETEIIAALGHMNDVETIESTCTEGGYMKYTCIHCGRTYNSNFTDPLGHSIIDGVCVRCGHTEKSGVYYGVSAIPERYNSSFILGLEHQEAVDSHLASISVTPLEGEYIYYCAPTSFGDCAFAYNNFVGGFTLIIEGLALTNASGKTESYNIYKSNQANLGVNGAITITIKEMG